MPGGIGLRKPAEAAGSFCRRKHQARWDVLPGELLRAGHQDRGIDLTRGDCVDTDVARPDMVAHLAGSVLQKAARHPGRLFVNFKSLSQHISGRLVVCLVNGREKVLTPIQDEWGR